MPDSFTPTTDSIKKEAPDIGLKPLEKMAATYSPTIRSTIGDAGLNFSVRNGKRWNPGAITTKNNGDISLI